MAKQLQLTVPTPCHEDWDAMTTVDKGKFCGSCQKQVVDFSNMSDRQVAEFFKKPSTSSVCGRFMNDQLDRAIEISKKRIPWVKYFFQFALPAFLLSIKSTAARAQGKVIVKSSNVPVKQSMPNNSKVISDTLLMEEAVIIAKITTAQPMQPYSLGLTNIRFIGFQSEYIGCGVKKAPVIDISSLRDLSISAVPKQIDTINWRSILIDGTVTNDKREPIPGASVRVIGTRPVIVADTAGKFSLSVYPGEFLKVSCAGYEGTEVQLNNSNLINISLKPIDYTNPVMVVGGAFSFSTKTYRKRMRAKSAKQIIKDTLLKSTNFFSGTSFRIFPNPVAAGSTINIESKQLKEGDYNMQIINQSGQSVHQQEIWIDSKTTFSMKVPTVTAGTYFLVLINKKTGKKYSEKIIIQ
jgi:hypothetical protein